MTTWTKLSQQLRERARTPNCLLVLTIVFILWVQPTATTWAQTPHTITIDGINDFAANEDMPGTTGSTWYFTWDASNFYFGVNASDVAANSATKWAWLYLDTDPQQTPLSGLGSSTGVNYNTQTPGLPFRADYHFRWRTDNTYVNLLDWNSGTNSWTDDNTGSGNFGVAAFQSGTFVEFKIPRASLGNPSQIYVCGAMINEQGGVESTFFLTPPSNGPDGNDKDFAHYFGFPLVDNIAPDFSGNEDTYPVASISSDNYSSGTTWTGGVAPHNNSNVFIQNGHTVTLDATGNAKHFTVISSGTFSGSTNTLNIANGGLLTNNGTFNGSGGTVNFAGTGTISGTTTFNNVVLAGGVNFGTAATVNGALQINTGGFVNTNAPTYGSAATLKYNSGGSYNASTEWTAAASNGAGVPQNVQMSNNTTLNLGSSNRTANGNLTIDTGSTLTSTSGILTIGGDFTKNGTFTHNSGNVTFNKNGNQTISGTGTTTFNTVTLNMGTSSSNVLDVQSVIVLTGPGNRLIITNGTFKLSSNSTIAPFANGTGATIPASGGFWVNGGTIAAGNYSWTLNGLLRVSNGTLNIGNSSGNSLVYNGTGSTITIEGGTLNIAGRLSPNTSSAQTTTYSQSGGTVTVVTVGSTTATRAGFEMTSGSSFTMNGGTIVVQRATSNASDYLNLAATNNVTGGMLQIGDGNSPNNAIIRINSTAPVYYLTVNNSTANPTKPTAQLVSNALTIKGDATIQSGTTLNANTFSINLAGNWSNSGTFTPSTGTVTLNGGSSQTLTGATTFNNLTINNASGAALANDETVSNTLTFTNGNITTNSNKMIINAGGTVSRISGHVVGNLQKNFATGVNVTRTFEIGTGSDYTPAEVTIASVGTTGNVTAKSTSGDHGSIASSNLDGSKSVNRNWTLTKDGSLAFTTYNSTFNFVSGDLDGGTNTTNLLVGKLDAGTWTYPTVGTRSATSTQATGMTSFSDFQLAEPLAPAGVTITESDGSTNITEGGATDTYTMVLNSTPTSNVTITFNPGSQIAAMSAVTFTPANALTPQTITVSAVDDGLVEGAHTGTITHTATSSDGNYDGISIASVTANITDNEIAITANAGNDAAGCFGSSFNLDGAAGGGDGSYSFAWTVQSGPNTGSAQFNNATLEDPAFTPALAGIYVLRFTVDDGVNLAVFDEVQITVNALPTATVSGTATICEGSSTTISAALTGTGPWNLTWSDGFIQNGVAVSPATRSVSPANTTIYTVISVSDVNCTGNSSGSAVVTVNPLPTATVSGTATICAGSSTTISTALTGTGPWNLTWSDGFTQNDVPTSPATRSVNPASTTTYTVISFADANCTGSSSGSATVTVTPGITVSFNPVGPFCENTAAVDLSSAVSPSGGIFSGPGISGNMFNPATAGVGTHTITYSVTSGACTASANQNITVNALPTATVSGTATICAGSSTTLTAALTGTSPWNITWSDGFIQNGVAVSPATRSVSPANTTIYTVISVSDVNCTGNSSGSAVVTVNPLPTATVSGTATICAGSSTTISAALTGTGPWNLTWSDGFTQNDVPTSPATRSVNPASTTTYTVTSFADANCTGSSAGSATVTVTPGITVSFNPVGPFCVNTAAVDLSSAASPSGGTFSGAGISGSMFNPATAGVGTHTITYSLTSGACTASANQNIIVRALPTATVTGTTNLCSGGSATISATLTGSGPWNITWSDGLTQTGVTASPTTRSVSPAGTTIYTVALVSDANCTGTSSGSAIITVKALPTATVSGTAEICAGSSTTLSATLTGTPPWNLTWSDGLTQTGVATNPATRSVSPASTTTYTVTSMTANGCSNTGAGSATITVNPKPIANAGSDQTINSGQTVQIGGGPTASGGTPGYTYSWTPTSGLDNAIAANPNATVTSTTTYTVVVTDSKGCTATDQMKVTILSTSLGRVFLAEKLVKIKQNKESDGDIHSNNDIEFDDGTAPGKHAGNLTAVDDIIINGGNTIQGDVIAGDNLHLSHNTTVTGSVIEDASVAVIPLPTLSFSAGGVDVTVPSNGLRTLAPGSYDEVEVKDKATLNLSAGDYFMRKLKISKQAKLSINVGAGSVNINVVSDLSFGEKTQVVVMGGSTAQVTFASQQDNDLDIGKNAIIRGTIIAPEADLHFLADSRFKGTATAKSIILEPKVKFQHHNSTAPFPKPSELDDASEIAFSEAVTNYALEPNYPNPFNPSTIISLQLPAASDVTLSVYNLRGQLVRELLHGEKNAGHHAIRWDGRDNAGDAVAAGVYLYRLIVTGANGQVVFTQTRRMVFVK